MLPDASYKGFAQKNRCCLMNNKMAVKFLDIMNNKMAVKFLDIFGL